jgi:hypothetical protein
VEQRQLIQEGQALYLRAFVRSYFSNWARHILCSTTGCNKQAKLLA